MAELELLTNQVTDLSQGQLVIQIESGNRIDWVEAVVEQQRLNIDRLGTKIDQLLPGLEALSATAEAHEQHSEQLEQPGSTCGGSSRGSCIREV